jgi:hypothetical protein
MFKDNLSFIYSKMSSLRKEIEEEMARVRIDKTRLFDLLLKIVDKRGGGGESSGPQGPPGPPGPAGPVGPQGPSGSGETVTPTKSPVAKEPVAKEPVAKAPIKKVPLKKKPVTVDA